MVFYCQRNCYEQSYTTRSVSCKPTVLANSDRGKNSSLKCYEAIFEDTIFFPEGGGQPDDHGTANGIPVFRVLRKGGQAIHYLKSPIVEGSEVIQVLDWQRRHDHMQQHTGQHLITAIADNEFGYPTHSWNLGETISYIDLVAPKLTENELIKIEELANMYIREAVPVEIKEYEDSDPELKQVRTRGLPEDVVGPVRVVTMKGIDSNMCCGTHVRNLADLQAIKILNVEKGKNNRSLLYFVVGSRVLSYLGGCFRREKELNCLLHTNSMEHITIIKKLQKDLKTSQRSLKEVMKDIALFEAKAFLDQVPKPKFFFHFRKDADSDYLGFIISALDDENILKILMGGEERGEGILIVAGPPALVTEVAPRICEILGGKGGGKTRFTAKVTNLGKRNDVMIFLEDHFKLAVSEI